MCTRVYVAASNVGDATVPHTGHAGPFNVPVRLFCLSACLHMRSPGTRKCVPPPPCGWNHDSRHMWIPMKNGKEARAKERCFVPASRFSYFDSALPRRTLRDSGINIGNLRGKDLRVSDDLRLKRGSSVILWLKMPMPFRVINRSVLDQRDGVHLCSPLQ